ncbi:MAG: MG2 domain-containing protein [Bacteroidetes bacterium]|nr:MG2 domain-containing protein [Bacteroidota bacterium]MCL2301984.1 MG2 domain-containing protein [Lentimicrobiaceae bacterium]
MYQAIKATLLSIALLFTMNTFAQNKPTSSEVYEKLWKQVEAFNNDALPQSALKIVEEIYALAISENNEKQIIKSIVHKMSYLKTLDEDGIKTTIIELESQMPNYAGIVKPFMHLFLAKMYEEYFNFNSHAITQRSITANFENNDMSTWDRTRFQNKIITSYLLALDNILKNEDISEYSDFILNTVESEINFPTLYDFVAYYSVNQLSMQSANRFGFRNNNDGFRDNTYLSDVEKFINLSLSGDTLSFNYTALKIYQNWLKFRLENSENIEALVNTDLMRLSFVRNNLITADRDRIWETALVNLQKKYNNVPELAQINWELAKYYNQLGESYNFLDSTTFQYKMYKAKAVALLEDAMVRFPNARFYAACYDLRNDIKETILRFEVGNIVNANERFPLRITYRNTEYFTLTILKCDYEKFLNITENQYSDKYFSELLNISEQISHIKEIALYGSEDFNTHFTEYLTEPLPYGFYVIVLETKENEKVFATVFSSDLCMLTKGNNNDNSGLYILNRKTGQPVANAKVELYMRDYDSKQRQYIYKKEKTVHTDKTGYVNLNTSNISRWQRYYRVDVSYKNDFISENANFSSSPEREAQKRTEVNFFTDRAIYRPGQIVHFKGICLERQGDEVKILPNHSVNVSFRDVNWQNISSLNLVSNEYGTISGSFTIPLGVLTGNFTIQTTNGSRSILVEEYKRPMFEVKTLPVEGEYRINDSVTIEGIATTFAGTALTDAKVSYTVVRHPLWRPFFGRVSSTEIAFGDLTLDDEGKFRITFKAEIDEVELLKNFVAYNYTVNIYVTDINGETQTISAAVFVSNRALQLSSNIKSYIIKEQIDSISITSQNVSGVFTPVNVEVTVFKLKDNEKILAKKPWERINQPLYSKEEWYKKYPGHEFDNETDFSTFEAEKTVFQKKINTADTKNVQFDGIEKWASGVYRMVLKSVDKWGNPVENVQEFVLFSEKDKKTPYNATDFFYVDKTSAQPGQTVTLYVGSSYKNVHLFYDLEAQGKTIKTETIKLNSEIKKIIIPIDESHRGNIAVNLIFVKDGRVYRYNQIISVPWENKKLDIKFITFRDKTLPGAHESWQLKISDYLSKPAEAEFMASLYDASLDVFAKNNWSLNPFPVYNSRLNWNGLGFNNAFSRTVPKDYTIARLFQGTVSPNLTLFNPYSNYSRFRKGETSFDVYSFEERQGIEVQYAAPSFSQDNTTGSAKSVVADEEVLNEAEAVDLAPLPIQIRRNFSETAFFYPTLTTNEAGEIFLNFTMPESLTRWNFLGLAHTKNLKIGTITEEIITQKELMVMPNLPRFFRENDKMTISAKINNVSEADISGNATIEFFDVETLKSLNLNFLNSNVPTVFNVPQNGNTVVEWQITIPEGLSAVGVRIIAEGKNHSDGEERILPILSNKMLVTESMPLPVRKAGTTNFKFKSLANNKSTTLRNESFTLEFTANPAWYAVQALPYLMEFPHECAEQVFARLYANSLASHIANSDPKIQRVFELWRTIPGSNALLSSLEKNQELKALLIEETPWLLNAKDESERKRRIGLLFDLNRMAMENSTAIKKLSEMQTSNGGFPWFSGMRESWYITQHIAGGLARLDKLGVTDIRNNAITWNMAQQAIAFIDKELERGYNDLKKHCNADCLKKDNISYIHIHYLYIRSFFMNDVALSESTTEAFNYYKDQAIKYWTKKGFYMQGMIALALNKLGEKTVPAKIVASLKEHAIHNEEMGMYWKFGNGFHWYQAPIETQALLIEVFSDIANDQKSVEEMKVWLLKQKQTQDWRTTKATTEAIYALLLRGANLLAETDFPIITIGDMTIDAASDPEIKTEAGTGYFQKRWDGSLIDPSWANVSVTKKSNTVAWGAVYWQYFEQLDKIKQFEETPLKINKQLFVERRSGNQTVIVPIPVETDNYPSLQVGDKVRVRIEIRTDRDMEYVHLKDMRAACFEPVDHLSGYRFKAGFGYYQGIKDASMNFFIDYLRRGTYVFEYDLRVSQKGDFSNGITTIQSMYAPEFTSHSEGVRVVISD